MLRKYKTARIVRSSDWFKQPLLDIQRIVSALLFQALRSFIGRGDRKISFPPKSILIIRRNKLGDAVSLLPVIRMLGKEDDELRIDVLATPYNAVIFENMREVRSVFHVPERYKKNRFLVIFHPEFRRMREEQYDAAIVGSASFSSASAWMALFSKANFRVGVTSKYGALWDLVYHHRISQLETNVTDHQVYRIAKIFEGIGLDVSAKLLPEAVFTKRAGVSKKKGLVALCPLVARAQSRWSETRWKELAHGLASHEIEFYWVGVGFTDDEVKKANCSEDLLDILDPADLVVCCEGGVSHVAGALGKSLVVLSGMQIKETWSPWVRDVIVYEKTGCIDDIRAEKVLSQIFSRLNSGKFLVDESFMSDAARPL